MKKIIISGGEGTLGSQTNWGIKLGHTELDVLDPENIQKTIDQHRPDVILHMAAMLDMLGCENTPEKAYELNVFGTYNIARACRENNIKLVYLSSGAVFDGNSPTGYKEDAIPAPVNVYGRTKWIGEMVAKDLLPDVLIVRTGWLFGGVPHGVGVDRRFVNIMFQKINQGQETVAVSDRYGSPTYIPDFLQSIKKMTDDNITGLFHIVNDGVPSYFEIAKEIKKICKSEALIKPVKTSELDPSKLKRARMEGMTSTKIKLRPWKEALKEYVEYLLATK